MRFFAVLSIFVAVFFQNFEIFAQSKPAWISQVHYVEGDTHYFVGRSSRQLKNEDGVTRALANALSLVSKYIKAEVKSLSKSYEEAFKDTSEVVINDVFTERGAPVVVRNYIKESYFEKVISGGETYYETYVKIGISQNDIALMGIRATGATAWNFKATGCSDPEDILMVFKEASSRLGWKLEPEQSEKPGFSNNFPRTAYFASVKAKCSGGMMNVAVERYDLVEKLLVTSAFSKADSLRNLKSELFNSLQIYVPMVDFPEYPPPVITVTPFLIPRPLMPHAVISSSFGARNGMAPFMGSPASLGRMLPFAIKAQYSLFASQSRSSRCFSANADITWIMFLSKFSTKAFAACGMSSTSILIAFLIRFRGSCT